MILAINIGNTNIHWAIFKENRIIKTSFFSTYTTGYRKFLKPIFDKNKIEKVIICSVVPEATKKIKVEIKKLNIKEILILGENVKIPLVNLYRQPDRLGQDRLLNAFAGSFYYGTPLLVIDLGTAITFNFVSKDKKFLGGLILPGIRLSLKALQENTALLQKIRLRTPSEFIGRDTQQCILSGLIFGFSELIDGLIRKSKCIIGKDIKVVITGGDADLVFVYLKEKIIMDKDLALKGLNLLVDNDRNK